MASSDPFLFVSHVSEDREAATEIVAELERRGVPCWIAPRDVEPGKSFDDEIADALDTCRAMLLIFSERCNDSVYIRREVTVAGESQKAIIPFRIEAVEPRRGLRVRLSDLHWIDAFVSRENAVDELVTRFTRSTSENDLRHLQPTVPVSSEVPNTVASGTPALASLPAPPPILPLPGSALPLAKPRPVHAEPPPLRFVTESSSAKDKPNPEAAERAPVPPPAPTFSRRTLVLTGGGTAALLAAGAVVAGMRITKPHPVDHPSDPVVTAPSIQAPVRTMLGHSGPVATVAFAPNGAMLASGSTDGVRLWNPSTGELVRTIASEGPVTVLTFSPDGQTLAGAEDKLIKLRDPSGQTVDLTMIGHAAKVACLTFSPDSHRIVSASLDETVLLWSSVNGLVLRALEVQGGAVSGVAYSPDGGTFASSNMKTGSVTLWNAHGDKLRALSGRTGSILCVRFAPDGKTLASGEFSSDIVLWDPTTALVRRVLRGHAKGVATLSYSPDGRLLASGSQDNTIKIWDPTSGELLVTLAGHTDAVAQLAFSPDGNTLASGSADKSLRLWDVSRVGRPRS